MQTMHNQAGDGGHIYCWKHHCDETALQLTRTRVQECPLCNEIKTTGLVQLAQVSNPELTCEGIETDIVLSLASRHGADFLSPVHVGIFDGQGRILEFDKSGLMFNQPNRINSTWQRCLKLDFLQQIGLQSGPKIAALWDQIFSQIKDEGPLQAYNDETNNCLDFVQGFLLRFVLAAKNSGFLSSQQVDDLVDKISDKVNFCEDFVVPKTRELARYLALDRRMSTGATKLSTVYIQTNPEVSPSSS